MRGNAQARPPENISISISVNLRKGENRKQLRQAKPHSDNLLTKSKSKLPRDSTSNELLLAANSIINPHRPPKSSRTFSEAPETLRVKTGETIPLTTGKTKKGKAQPTRKKSEVCKKSTSNDKTKRRKDCTMNRSADLVPRRGNSRSKSKSKSKSSESSKSKSRSYRRRIKLETRYINTYENDGTHQRVPLTHKLPLEEMEHLVSRYRKESKHSASIEFRKGSPSKAKGHKKNATL